MNRTRLEWIPLHSFATSRLIPGRWNIVPVRRTVSPVRAKKVEAVVAEAWRRNSSSQLVAKPGKGTRKTRNPTGNASRRTLSQPKHHTKPAIRKHTKVKTVRDR